MEEKQKFSNVIRNNIDQYGYHVTIVKSAVEPRYAYTIGLNDLLKYELIFAGGIHYVQDELFQIFKGVVNELKTEKVLNNQKITIGSLGAFSLATVNPSWPELMMLGAFDYYGNSDVKAIQIIPDSKHYTLDIPDMTKVFNVSSEPVWQWLIRKWDYGVPENSTVITNINALQGETITELMRWESDEWEMFAGASSDVDEKEIRVIPLGTILGIDNSLLPAVNLEIGKGLWRDSGDSQWNDWG